MKKTVRFRELLETDNAAVAALVRDNLKKYKLDIDIWNNFRRILE